MSSQPNIIFITCHDLGRHLGCYGYETVGTPTIDGLARDGVRFENSFCVAPQCSPSRAAIATGRYPHSNGVMGLVHAGFAWDFREGETHLVDRFKAGGWRTAVCGVVHETHYPDRFGFDHIRIGKLWNDGEAKAMGVARTGCEYIEQQAGSSEPFYLQLGFFEPHRDPRHVTGFPATHRPARDRVTVPPYLIDDAGAREEFAFFEASIRTVDDAMAMLMQCLEKHNLVDNTLVIFSADHGAPFARAKCSVYDPGLEVPLIMRWPNGPWKAGQTFDAMVSGVDFVPTFCDLFGLPPADQHQGQSFAPLLKGESFEPRSEMFAEMTYHDYYDPVRAIRTSKHKLNVAFMFNRGFMDPSQQWFRKSCPAHPPLPAESRHDLVELYDLENDPLETKNLANLPEHAQTRDELLSRLSQWMQDSNDPLLEGVPMSPMHHRALDLLKQSQG